MNREEVNARSDVLVGERLPVGVTVGAGALAHADGVEMVRMQVALVAGDGLDALQLGDRGVVPEQPLPEALSTAVAD